MRWRPARALRRVQNSVSQSVPGPIGGWNARDSLDTMQAGDAVVLDNWFPREGYIETRLGSVSYCDTAQALGIKALMTANLAASQKMVAGVNGKLINVSSSSPSTLGTGFASDLWKYTNFHGKIFMVALGNAPQDWDGTSLASTSWTGSGLTITNLIDTLVYRSRIYFIESNTANLWYGGTDAITGALSKFDLSGLGNTGGKLIGFETQTNDGGDGADDLLILFMSSGDIIVYGGANPSDSSWNEIGVFHAGALVANGSCRKIGSDLVAITQDGFVALNKIFPFGRNLSTRQTISDKISNAASFAVQTYAANNGWSITLYPNGSKLIFNVPRSAAKFDQYIMNINTGAWCRFTGWDGQCFTVYNGSLYFGGTDGIVYHADTGYTDNSSAIVCETQTAWNYFGDRAHIKRFTMARPIFQSVHDSGAIMALGVDYDSAIPTNALTTITATAPAQWDTAVWDQSLWADSIRTARSWDSLYGIGYNCSLRLRIATNDQQVRWFSTNYVFEPGGVL